MSIRVSTDVFERSFSGSSKLRLRRSSTDEDLESVIFSAAGHSGLLEQLSDDRDMMLCEGVSSMYSSWRPLWHRLQSAPVVVDQRSRTFAKGTDLRDICVTVL